MKSRQFKDNLIKSNQIYLAKMRHFFPTLSFVAQQLASLEHGEKDGDVGDDNLLNFQLMTMFDENMTIQGQFN